MPSSFSRGQSGGALCEGLPPYVYDPPVEAVVFGWGVSEDGQLALDTDACVMAPKVVEALLGARLRGREFRRSPLVAGSRNTLGITANGEVYSWGWNARATLGHGHRDPVTKPLRIEGLAGVTVVQVALGGWHALALDEDGQVWAWGGNEYSQCAADPSLRDVTTPTRCVADLRVRQVAAGGMHSLALSVSGQIWQWGEPWGSFSMTINRTPRRIDRTSNFVSVVCGAFHNLALDANGEVWSWGINDFGQLGVGTTSYATEPQKVTEGLEGVRVADIAAGGWHSLALGEHGEVYVWGRGEYGRLGLGDKTGSSKLRPTRIAALEGIRVVEASCGGTHTAVVTDDGRAIIWGRGGLGRLGTGEEKDCYSPVEVKLPGGPERWRAISVAVGGRHSLVLAVPDNGHLHADSNREQRLADRERSLDSIRPDSRISSDSRAPPGAATVATRRAHSAALLSGEAPTTAAADADDEGGDVSEIDEVYESFYEDIEEEEEADFALTPLGEKSELKEAVAEAEERENEEIERVQDGTTFELADAHAHGVVATAQPGTAVATTAAAPAAVTAAVAPSLIGSSPRDTSDDGGVYDSDNEERQRNGGAVMRMRSLAAATVHGLRDDAHGDRS